MPYPLGGIHGHFSESFHFIFRAKKNAQPTLMISYKEVQGFVGIKFQRVSPCFSVLALNTRKPKKAYLQLLMGSAEQVCKGKALLRLLHHTGERNLEHFYALSEIISAICFLH